MFATSAHSASFARVCRAGVRDFVARYTEWLIEKNGLRSPSNARAAWNHAVIRAAA